MCGDVIIYLKSNTHRIHKRDTQGEREKKRKIEREGAHSVIF